MQIQERLIVPGLGVVIVLSAFMLGVPLVYKLILGLLGLAAAGTYFAPRQVQVEIRVAVAALGLIILLIVISTAFWLTLLSFGAIAALQFPHRRELQWNPATIAWLGTVLKAAQARRSGRVDGGAGAEAGAAAAARDGESAQAPAPPGASALPGFVRVNAAGISGLVAGVLVLMSVFLPWFGFLISASGETAGGLNFTLRTASGEFELPAFGLFFFTLIALGLLSIVSIVLPRVVAAIIAGAGLAVTLTSYLYVVGLIQNEADELSDIGVGVTAVPAIGALLAGLCFLVMFVLQLIPKANASRGAG
ncbi:MAG: hypothetical protein OXE02_14045 [Chloroflexi bacterium]|nr:hypothetical protein [Chloroflexota bacterium]